MKRENVEIGNKRIDTLIGKDSTFTGNIESAGTIRIDGNFEGEISTKGDLVIGENGQVKGKVKAQNIVVAGKMEGELEASGKLELVPSANVQGEVKMMLLVVEEGAVFQGNCQQYTKDQTERGKFLQFETPKEGKKGKE
ncbi:MAG TPA: polymer-forming cytoskeletal protein [Firmicutes bacterium]|nr:polymer-forming cytoskeletal protein [Bacillota bacterium]